MSLQVVYVLTSPAMQGLVKIGKATMEDVSIRLSHLYSTGVPFPFELAFACKVPSADEVEKALHRAFHPSRVNSKREFLSLDPEQPIAILKLLHVTDARAEISALPTAIPEEDLQATKAFRARRPNMNFNQMGIPLGATLQFTDGPQTVVVVAPRKILFNGEELALTVVTRTLLDLDDNVAPGPYWTWEGKSLRDLYNETYSQPEN